MSQDSFTINFAEGYIVTLVKTVGPENAKKRLFEEGSVAFKNEIERVVKEIEARDDC
jgi:hypothetical protein